MIWIVTGGAGYIGSHVVRAFLRAGREVVVVDDLSSGHRAFVPDGVAMVEGSVGDRATVDRALLEFGEVAGVVHLAGFKYAGVAMQRPLHTYEQNVTAMQALLGRMVAAGVHRMVFSSSAACYGTPDVDLVTESAPTRPESPYGESKLIGEWLLRDLARVTPMRYTSLRYFNVVGSGPVDLFDTSPHNLFPRVLRSLTEGGVPVVFGTDYPTPDGSAVRDYVHVSDVADAHVAAAEVLERGGEPEPVYNLGSGDGLSVLEIMAAFARGTGIAFEPELRERRPGDPARIIASGDLARRDLGWAMRHDVDDMVVSAWAAWQGAVARWSDVTSDRAGATH